MILFRCPSCGAAYRVEDTYAGGSADCQNCGHHISIPNTSDPDVVLVFHAGESEEGRPMAREDVARAFESGELLPTDLVLDGGVWRPLAVELRNMDQSATLGDKSRLSYNLEIVSPQGRTVLESLPLLPIDRLKRPRKTSPGETDESGENGGAKKPHFSVFAPPPSEKDEAAPTTGQPVSGPKKLRLPRSAWIGLQVVVGLAALAAGYKFGLGPLVSAMRGRPTVVFVAAPDTHGYEATLGWRHLHQRIPRGGKACAFMLYVCGTGEHQTLRLHRSGSDIRISLYLKPGRVLLVNPGGKRTFAVIEPGRVESKRLGKPRKRLIGQITHNLPPLAAVDAAKTLGKWAESIYVGTASDPILSGKEYRFAKTMVSLDSAVSEALYTLKIHPAKVLVDPGVPYDLKFKEGRIETLVTGAKRRNAVIRLEKKTVVLPAKLEPKIPQTAELRMIFTDQAVSLALDLENQIVASKKGKLHGRWEYRAQWVEGDVWHWSWTYHGQCKFKEKTKVHGKTKTLEKTLRVRLKTVDDNPVPIFELE